MFRKLHDVHKFEPLKFKVVYTLHFLRRCRKMLYVNCSWIFKIQSYRFFSWIPTLNLRIFEMSHEEADCSPIRLSSRIPMNLDAVGMYVSFDRTRLVVGVNRLNKFPWNNVRAGGVAGSRLSSRRPWQRSDWVANKRFEISKFKFKFPRARTYEIIGFVLGCIEAKFCK